ncbi:MAG: CPBP family intramembrane glutamic endopeptidase [Bacteroidales bacterium]|jgi:membrane protease YdiL (CAAX protease family)|nr:CPBP family intramembrane glutamic endopeptidase [Bacteroidales bacterium]
MKYQIILFCFLAYFISWGSKFLISAADTGLLIHQIPKGLLELIAQFGPTIAGIITIFVLSGRIGILGLIKNLSRFNIKIKWYLFALLFELILFIIIVLLIGPFMDINADKDSISWWQSIKNFLLNTIYLTLLTGLGEEIGWRGFLLPKLQACFPIIFSAIILSIINSLWHLRTTDLIFILNGNLTGFWHSFLPDMGLRFIISTPVIFVIVYLFNKTKGSLIVMILFHGSSNASYEWVKDITGVNDPSFILPLFAGVLWLTSIFFVPALIKQGRKKEIVTSLTP